MAQDKPRILFLDMFDTTSAYYRIYLINDALVRQDKAIAISAGALWHHVAKHDTKEMAQHLRRCSIASDIIIIQQYPTLETIEWIKAWRYMNKLVLIESDDLADNTTETIDRITQGRARSKWLNRIAVWSQADGFLTSTKYLAEHYSAKFNKPAYVFNNYLDFTDDRWQKEKVFNDKIIIGYMGSMSHTADVGMIKDTILYIADKHPQVEFRIMGACPIELINSGRENIKRIKENFNISEYTKEIAQFDIGLAPLEDLPFNRAKSDLKFLEYARFKIPGIYSKVQAYRDSVVNGHTGILTDNTPEAWALEITKLIIDEKKRAKIGAAAFEYCRTKRDILDHTDEFLKLLKKAQDERKTITNTSLIIPRKGIIIPTC